jgi:hypothetical protein
MRLGFPGFGYALGGSLALLSGCGSGALGTASSAPRSAPGAPGASTTELSYLAKARSGEETASSSAPTAPAPESAPAPPSDPSAAPKPGSSLVAPSREMLDIEATVEMRVSSVRQTLKQLHAISARVGGVITAERVDSASTYDSATLTLRVPSGATQGVFAELEKLGDVLNQTVTARDVSKDYFDATLRLSTLEATLRRYEEILTKANKVEEILRIEQELARLRAEIEQVKGNLRWLQDRTARATLHLALREQAPEVARSEEPEPQFYPGLRAPLLLDFGKSQEQTYGGGGVSLRFMRQISLDLDVLKRFDSETRGPDALVATVGGEVYSNLLGGGRRSYLNPYLGWRAGYARFDEDDQALLGATFGVELFKNRWFCLDLEARNYLAFGGGRGAHYALAPALAASLAF